jgi:hypothetical protein
MATATTSKRVKKMAMIKACLIALPLSIGLWLLIAYIILLFA